MKGIILKIFFIIFTAAIIFLLVRFFYLRWYLKQIESIKIVCPKNLSGAFIQPTYPVNQYTEEQTAVELNDMHKIGLTYVVLQWSADSSGRKSIYPSKIYQKDESFTQDDFIDNLLTSCDKYGMKVYLGLDIDSDWEKNTMGKNKNLFDREIDLSAKTADELYEKYKSHASFYGWYLPNEISDLTVISSGRRVKLHKYLNSLCLRLKGLDNTKKISIAPYFSKFIYPPRYESIWKYLLCDSHVDVVMLQDGVGCKRIKLGDIASYFGSMKKAADYAHVELYSDVEVFEQIHGGKEFEAKPANMQTIEKQLSQESRFVSAQVCFDYPHYMSLQNSDRTAELYKDYQEYIKKEGIYPVK